MLLVNSEGRKHDGELKLSVHLKGQANTFSQDKHTREALCLCACVCVCLCVSSMILSMFVPIRI